MVIVAMELTLITRSAAELNAAVKAIILGVDGAIAEAQAENDGRATVHPPQNLVIRGVMITGMNVDTVEETDTSPATTITTTDTVGESVETSLQTPPNRTTSKSEGGGDRTDVDIDHEEF